LPQRGFVTRNDCIHCNFKLLGRFIYKWKCIGHINTRRSRVHPLRLAFFWIFRLNPVFSIFTLILLDSHPALFSFFDSVAHIISMFQFKLRIT